MYTYDILTYARFIENTQNDYSAQSMYNLCYVDDLMTYDSTDNGRLDLIIKKLSYDNEESKSDAIALLVEEVRDSLNKIMAYAELNDIQLPYRTTVYLREANFSCDVHAEPDAMIDLLPSLKDDLDNIIIGILDTMNKENQNMYKKMIDGNIVSVHYQNFANFPLLDTYDYMKACVKKACELIDERSNS